MNLANHQHAFYVLLTIVFLAVLSFMFAYNKRSKDRQNSIEGNRTPASKEAGILEAQNSMKQDRQHGKH